MSRLTRSWLWPVMFLAGMAGLEGHAMTTEPTGKPVIEGELGEKLDTVMQRLAGWGFSGVLLVAKDGRIVLHQGYGVADLQGGVPVGLETVFDIGSITKQFTAAAIVKLESDGKLSVDDALVKYFPDAPEEKAGITLHQLLTHSAGLPDALGDDEEVAPRDDLVRQALASELLFPPGERYEYSNVGYSLLAAIVEKASGQSYEAYLREKLFLPAGMTATGYVLPEWKAGQVARGQRGGEDWGLPTGKNWAEDGPYWHLKGNGGILSSAGDMYRWHQALLGDEILPAAAKEKMFTPHVREGGGNSFYGYGWSIVTTQNDGKLITHNGGNGIFMADLYRFVDEGVFVYIASNTSEQSAIAAAPKICRLARGQDVPLPPAIQSMAPAGLSKYEGEYRLEGGETLRVSSDGSSLTLDVTGAQGMAFLSGADAETTQKLLALNARLEAAIQAAANGEFELLARAFGDDMSAEELGQMWTQILEHRVQQHGPLEKITVVGSMGRNGPITSFVLYRFENGQSVTQFEWRGDQIVGADMLRALPRFELRPLSETEFGGFDLGSWSSWVVRIRLDGNGNVQALLAGPEGEPVVATKEPGSSEK